MKSIPIHKFIPGIAWFFVVLILICLPGGDIPQPESWMQQIHIDKLAHIGIFGLLAYLFMRPVAMSSLDTLSKREFFIRVALATCTWGIATELIQKYFVSDRSFDWFDWICDSTGALGAYYFCAWYYLK